MTNSDIQSDTKDHAALQESLQQHLPRLQAFIRLRMDADLRARESCSDLAQSVCLDMLRNVDAVGLRDDAALKAWLYTSAMNKIRERRRFHRAEKRNSNREAGSMTKVEAGALAACYASFTPSRHAMGREELKRIEAAFDELTEEHREVITLARIIGLPHAEIGRLMNRSEEASRALLTRAMIRLVSLLDPRGSE